jgi:DNA-binding NtrC family response regulator
MTSSSHKTPSTGPHKTQGAAEVLLFDKDERVRDGLRKLLSAAGLLITAMDDEERMILLASQKHFAVAVLDADTPTPDQGIAIIGRVKTVSPATAVVLLVNRQTFDLAVRGYRGGASEVVAKLPESVKVLTERVQHLCEEAQRSDHRDHLLRETLEIHEQFLKKLIEASRRAQQAEEMSKGQSGRWDLKDCTILVVDENARTAAGLQEALGKESPYHCVAALNGGEALDYGGQHPFQIALINERIPDLPWRMLVKSLRGQASDALYLLFTDPASGPGKVSIIEESQTIELVPELSRGAQLVEALHQMREAYVAKSRERHYLQSFRREHYDFLKRYVELRQQLNALLPTGKK